MVGIAGFYAHYRPQHVQWRDLVRAVADAEDKGQQQNGTQHQEHGRDAPIYPRREWQKTRP